MLAAVGEEIAAAIAQLTRDDAYACQDGFCQLDLALGRTLDELSGRFVPLSDKWEDAVGAWYGTAVTHLYLSLPARVRELFSVEQLGEWCLAFLGLPAIAPGGQRKWLRFFRESYLPRIVEERRKFFLHKDPEAVRYYSEPAELEGALAIKRLPWDRAWTEGKEPPRGALSQLDHIPWPEGVGRPKNEQPVPAEKVAESKDVAALIDLRDLADALRDHALLRDLAQTTIAHGRSQLAGWLVETLPRLLSLLDEAADDPAMQGALVYEWGRRASEKHGQWTRAAIAESYRTTAKRLERRSKSAARRLEEVGLR